MKRKIIFFIFGFIFITGVSLKAFNYYEKFYYKPDLTVIGFIEMWDGLGRQSAEIMEALTKHCSIRFWQTRKSYFDNLSPAVLSIVKKKRAQLGHVVIYEDIFYPSSYHYFSKKFTPKNKDSIKIAYTMFESTLIPKYWVENLNTFFDAAVVPDPYYIKVYQDSGVTIPIFSLPLGLNLTPFLSQPIKTQAHTPFVFGCFSTCYLRKNHVQLVRAFHQAFGNSPCVKLIINCKSSLEDAFSLLEEELKQLKATNIEVTKHCYDKKEYLEQFSAVDCYVNLSKAEGFSIQPREAMALGIPVIVSNNTAQTTLCQSHLVEGVSCPTTEPAYYEHFQETFGVRFNIDINEAAEKMKSVYENYSHHLKTASERRIWASQYDYSYLKKFYKTLVKPKEVVLSSENKITENILMTNSIKLKDKYDKIISKKN